MPTFLWFYLGGLCGAVAVGFVAYYVVGAYCGPMLQKLFGERAGHLWGRSFRMMMVISALVGGLSTQWYGCGGLTDYEQVEKDRRLMFQKSTEQVAGAINTTRNFLLVAAGLGAVTFAFLWRGRRIEPEAPHSTLASRNRSDAAKPPAATRH